MDPRVTVVMISRDRVDDVLRTLRRHAAEQVVLVDNASSDGTPDAVAAAFPAVDVVRLRENRGGAARNVGVERARTPYVAFSDDDSWWARGALTRAADVLDAHPRLALLNGHILVGPERRDDPVCTAMGSSALPATPDRPGHPIASFIACGAVVRRDAFFAVGGFLPELQVGGEEEVLAADLLAAGWQLAYLPEVVAHHHPSATRDPAGRRAVQLRNALWTTWLRRPTGAALRRSATLVARAPRDRTTLRALAQTAAGVPWILRRRRPQPPHVEALHRRLEAAAD